MAEERSANTNLNKLEKFDGDVEKFLTWESRLWDAISMDRPELMDVIKHVKEYTKPTFTGEGSQQREEYYIKKDNRIYSILRNALANTFITKMESHSWWSKVTEKCSGRKLFKKIKKVTIGSENLCLKNIASLNEKFQNVKRKDSYDEYFQIFINLTKTLEMLGAPIPLINQKAQFINGLQFSAYANHVRNNGLINKLSLQKLCEGAQVFFNDNDKQESKPVEEKVTPVAAKTEQNEFQQILAVLKDFRTFRRDTRKYNPQEKDGVDSCHHCGKPGHHRRECYAFKREQRDRHSGDHGNKRDHNRGKRQENQQDERGSKRQQQS